MKVTPAKLCNLSSKSVDEKTMQLNSGSSNIYETCLFNDSLQCLFKTRNGLEMTSERNKGTIAKMMAKVSDCICQPFDAARFSLLSKLVSSSDNPLDEEMDLNVDTII